MPARLSMPGTPPQVSPELKGIVRQNIGKRSGKPALCGRADVSKRASKAFRFGMICFFLETTPGRPQCRLDMRPEALLGDFLSRGSFGPRSVGLLLQDIDDEDAAPVRPRPPFANMSIAETSASLTVENDAGPMCFEHRDAQLLPNLVFLESIRRSSVCRRRPKRRTSPRRVQGHNRGLEMQIFGEFSASALSTAGGRRRAEFERVGQDAREHDGLDVLGHVPRRIAHEVMHCIVAVQATGAVVMLIGGIVARPPAGGDGLDHSMTFGRR